MIRKLARPLLAAVFITSGAEVLRRPRNRMEAASPLLDRLIPALGLPDNKMMLVRAEGATMVAGGAMLATGRVPRVAALALATALVPATVVGHAFWEKDDPDARTQDRQHFLKNLGLLGGLMLATVDTEGKPSLAWRARQRRKTTTKRINEARGSRG
ncbi:MAG: hypothetical protein CSA84_02890 [Actinomycetales bacterium]|nr:MAG: hypothetical protein CSA84_02890 [Actinomycetales bacterium]